MWDQGGRYVGNQTTPTQQSRQQHATNNRRRGQLVSLAAVSVSAPRLRSSASVLPRACLFTQPQGFDRACPKLHVPSLSSVDQRVSLSGTSGPISIHCDESHRLLNLITSKSAHMTLEIFDTEKSLRHNPADVSQDLVPLTASLLMLLALPTCIYRGVVETASEICSETDSLPVQ
jgi:hypothetical protein